MVDHAGPHDASRLAPSEAGQLVDHAAAAVAAGLPLDQIFFALAEDTDNRRLRRVARRLAEQLARGVDLGTALVSLGPTLPSYLERALASSAERGQVEIVIQGLARHETTRKRLRRQIRSLLLYPAIVFVLMVAVFAVLTWIVVPQFTEIFFDFGLELPKITELLLAAGEMIPTLLLFVLLVPLLYALVGMAPGGRRLLHWLRTGFPLFGRIWIWDGQHEFSSLLWAMTANRVTLDEALECTAASLRDRNLARAVRIAAAKCEGGAALSQSLSESMHFDPALPALVGWGETNGDMPEAMRQAMAVFEDRCDVEAIFIRRVFPPLLFVAVTTTIFLFVIALLTPLVDLINNLSG